MSRFGFTFFVLALFLGTTLPLLAQTNTPEKKNEITFSPGPSTMMRMFQFMTVAEQQGKTMFLKLGENEFQHFIGLTPAQELHLGPQLDALEEKYNQTGRDYIEQLNNWQNLSPEALGKLEDEFVAFYDQGLSEASTIVQGTLTPEQIQKAQMHALTVPSMMSQFLGEPFMLNFSALEALDLSEEQKEKLAKVQEEMKSETDEFFKELTDTLQTLLPKNGEEPSEELQKKIMETVGKLQEKGKSLAKKHQTQAEGILTKEQKEKLDTIREEMPKKLAEIREEIAKKAKENPEDESWKDSWKPGDPLPEGAVPPPRKPRFPIRF